MDGAGERLASRRLPEGLGIETDWGLWIHALAAAGYEVYAVNPLAVARYRERHNVGGPVTSTPTSCATRCASTTRRLKGPSPTRPIAMLRPCSSWHPAPPRGLPCRSASSVQRCSAAAASAISTAGPPRDPGRPWAEHLAAPAAVGIIGELNRQISELESALTDHVEQHPDADTHRRFGQEAGLFTRHVRNRRPYDAVDQWAFCSLSTSPGRPAYYDQRRSAGDLHHQALRALGNRLVGILYGCLEVALATTKRPPGRTGFRSKTRLLLDLMRPWGV